MSIEAIARILLELNIPFTYSPRAYCKLLEVPKNGRIEPFLISDNLTRMIITNKNHETIDLQDLMIELTKLFTKPA